MASSILLLIVIGYFIMHPPAWAEEMAGKNSMLLWIILIGFVLLIGALPD